MSLLTFHCPQCRREVPVQSARLFNSHFIRCDSCFAITGLTASMRLEMVKSAYTSPSPGQGRAAV
jgi:hypothetical protein